MIRRTAAAALTATAFLLSACTSSGSSSQPSESPSSAGATTSSGASTTSTPTRLTTYSGPPSALPAQPVDMSTSPPPWQPPALQNNGADSAAYVAAAGLPYGEEKTTVHYHAHLDVIVDGKNVDVPAYLGFVAQGNRGLGLAPLHTHTPDGVIHIENDKPATFVLGQVFVLWAVRFTADCVGPYCTGSGKELAVFVNGSRYSGDPQRLVLRKHQEIAVVYGDAGHLPTPPASYNFPSGE